MNDQEYTEHRKLATQIVALYREIEKLAKKKPTERITPLISKKINHVIKNVREQVKNDQFLDAIETIPVQGEQVRLDECLILLAELKSVMDRQWHSQDFKDYRSDKSLTYQDHIMH